MGPHIVAQWPAPISPIRIAEVVNSESVMQLSASAAIQRANSRCVTLLKLMRENVMGFVRADVFVRIENQWHTARNSNCPAA